MFHFNNPRCWVTIYIHVVQKSPDTRSGHINKQQDVAATCVMSRANKASGTKHNPSTLSVFDGQQRWCKLAHRRRTRRYADVHRKDKINQYLNVNHERHVAGVYVRKYLWTRKMNENYLL